MKLTHCDLFFADAAILVEGNVERLLLPLMIQKAAIDLNTCYISFIEVGGAFAHIFKPLINFLGLTTLIITDIDSVYPPPTPTVAEVLTVEKEPEQAGEVVVDSELVHEGAEPEALAAPGGVAGRCCARCTGTAAAPAGAGCEHTDPAGRAAFVARSARHAGYGRHAVRQCSGRAAVRPAGTPR